MCWCECSEHAWGLGPLLPLSGIKRKGTVVKDGPEQQAQNVSLLELLGTCCWLLLCKHKVDGSCSPRLACGSRQYIIFIFWKERLRVKNWREPLEASAIGAQEPLMSNAPLLCYFVCFVLVLLLAAKSHLILMAEGGVSLAGAAASAKCGCKSQRVESELCRLPGLNWVAQRENILNAWYSKCISFSDWRNFWDEMAPKCQPCQFCVRNKWKLRWVLALGTHPKLWERGGNLYRRFQRARMPHLGLGVCPLQDQAHLSEEATQ